MGNFSLDTTIGSAIVVVVTVIIVNTVIELTIRLVDYETTIEESIRFITRYLIEFTIRVVARNKNFQMVEHQLIKDSSQFQYVGCFQIPIPKEIIDSSIEEVSVRT